jgi:hypothetical protein
VVTKITDAVLAKKMSSALRREHADVHSAIKQIERITGINALTASNWYKGRYAPKSSHLLTLAQHYPEVLRTLFMLLGIEPLWQYAVSLGLPETMHSKLNEKRNQYSVIGDKFVPYHVRVDARIAVQLNQRQLWFLGQLQQDNKMVAADIVQTWHVHAKTSRRDIKGLLEAELVVAIRAGRINNYQLL